MGTVFFLFFTKTVEFLQQREMCRIDTGLSCKSVFGRYSQVRRWGGDESVSMFLTLTAEGEEPEAEPQVFFVR